MTTNRPDLWHPHLARADEGAPHSDAPRHRSIDALEMCLSDFAILEALLHKGPQSVRELGRRIDLTSGSMTTAIDRLETRRLVTRADHATDRRAWVIHLTPAGRALDHEGVCRTRGQRWSGRCAACRKRNARRSPIY